MNKKVDTAADIECVSLTIKFQYWSGSDAQHNQKNLMVVLKEFSPLFS